MDPRFHLSRLLRRLHWMGLVMLACAAGGLALTRTLPPTYHAEARLLVSPLPDLTPATMPSSALDHLQLAQQSALTQEGLASLAKEIGLPDASTVSSAITIAPVGPPQTNARLPVSVIAVTVVFRATDAVTAASGANGVAARLVHQDRAMHDEASTRRIAAAEAELARLSTLVARASEALLGYRKAHADALPDSLGFRRDQQAGLQDRLLRLEADKSALAERRERMVRVTAAARNANAAVATSDGIQALPAIARPPKAADLELARTDEQMLALVRDIGRTKADIAALDASLAATPAHAVTLARLEQDLAARQAQHADAVATKARAEAQAALMPNGRINIIEKATPPLGPSSPKPALVLGASLGAGMVLGLALVVLLGLLRPSIDRPADLTHALGLAPFATLPYLPAPTSAGRVWALGLVTLLAASGTAVLLHGNGIELDQLVTLALRLIP